MAGPITPGPQSGSLAGLFGRRDRGRSFFPERPEGVNSIPAAVVGNVIDRLFELQADPEPITFAQPGPGPGGILLSAAAMGKTSDRLEAVVNSALQGAVFLGTKSERRFGERLIRQAERDLEAFQSSFNGFEKFLQDRLGARGFEAIKPTVDRARKTIADEFVPKIKEFIAAGQAFGQNPEKNAPAFRKAMEDLLQLRIEIDDDLRAMGRALASNSKSRFR